MLLFFFFFFPLVLIIFQFYAGGNNSLSLSLSFLWGIAVAGWHRMKKLEFGISTKGEISRCLLWTACSILAVETS